MYINIFADAISIKSLICQLYKCMEIKSHIIWDNMANNYVNYIHIITADVCVCVFDCTINEIN